MWWFQKNIISNEVITGKSKNIQRKALRDARKKIKKGELIDSHDFAMYLQTVDDRYAHIKADISNATRVINYDRVRDEKMAETRQLLEFFGQDQDELSRLFQIVAQKAKQANRIDDLRQEKLSNINISKLQASFDSLAREDR